MLPYTSLDAVTSPDPGTVRDLERVLARHTLHAADTGGLSFSDLTVRIEGSHDGAIWFSLGSVGVTTTARAATVTVDSHLVRYVRAVLSEDNFSGSPVITATIASGS